jgi:hypothetical protein
MTDNKAVEQMDKDYELFKSDFLAHADRLLRDKGASSKDVLDCLELAISDFRHEYIVSRIPPPYTEQSGEAGSQNWKEKLRDTWTDWFIGRAHLDDIKLWIENNVVSPLQRELKEFAEIIHKKNMELREAREEIDRWKASVDYWKSMWGKAPSMSEPLANNSPKEEDVEKMAISLDDAKKLRGYFGKNDASHFEHWAYTVFDKIIKSKSI